MEYGLSDRKVCENIVDLEVSLGKLLKWYPTIPAIEVTIPHVFSSLKTPRIFKVHCEQIKSLWCNCALLLATNNMLCFRGE
jgi:hypothetical protein